MSVSIGFALIVFAVLLAALLYVYARIAGKDWLPQDLKNAKVLAVEKDSVVDVPSRAWGGVVATRPIRLSGRSDQAYRLETGEVVLLEYKNRSGFAVFETDVAQLSLQAWQFRQQGMATAEFGFVVTRNRFNGRRKAHKVELFGDERCVGLIQRYLDVCSGQVVPLKKVGRKCDSCGHKERCNA